MNTKHLLLASALFCATSSPAYTSSTLSALRDSLEQTEAAYAKEAADSLPKKSNKFSWTTEDGDKYLSLGGAAKNEHRRGWRAETLNKANNDQTADFNNSFDLKLGLGFGKASYGKDVIKVGATHRLKYAGGDPGKMNKTSDADMKLTGGNGLEAVQKMPGHELRMPLGWWKHAWTSINLSTLLKAGELGNHEFKMGMFDFTLGRGIALGQFYGMSKPFLSILTAPSDFAPFSLLLSGDVMKGKLGYDLYFARLEDRGSSFKKVNEKVKGHLLGKDNTPERGIAKNNNLFAFRLKANYDTPRFGDLSTESYFMYNDASDQSIEMPNDAKSQLYTSGWMGEYARGNFEFGWETAFNRGHEQVYAIDRNQVQLVLRASPSYSGEVYYGYSHVIGAEEGALPTEKAYESRYTGKPIPFIRETVVTHDDPARKNDSTYDIVAGSEQTANGDKIASAINLTSGKYDIYNAKNRFRQRYKNDYRGWMAVVDASYNYKPFNAKFSVAAGHASGDTDPHAVERDKHYQGFVGLHELYAGKRVKSVLLMGARKTPQTLSSGSHDKKPLNDPSFSDITHVGTSIEWKSTKRKLTVNPNMLFFWKDKQDTKYEYDSSAKTGNNILGELASRFMGTELNVIFEWEVLKDLTLAGQFAVLLPGSYYTDTKHTPISAKFDAGLDTSDATGVTQELARRGDDPAFYATVGFQYKF